ncbi:MAG TPA: hypothetical protein VEU55_01095 [Gemmatimonadales bacterium]|nr:hypothetical protein [Gemmatimonadales bacterium]
MAEPRDASTRRERPGPSRGAVLLVVSIDTEEDNWSRSRTGVTVENIAELPRLATLLRRFGVRATYFTTYQVAASPRARDVLRELRGGDHAEIGAHLHPWNTPPLDEAFVPRNSMLKNLPPSLQLAKLQRLTAMHEEAFGAAPTAFRAGRYGLGPETVAALIRCGYLADSSVTPFVSWETADDGPSFIGAPLAAYRLNGHGDVRVPVPDGPLVEVPMSTGFTRSPLGRWAAVWRALGARPVGRLRLRGLAAHSGLVRRIALSPELASVADMLALSGRLLSEGVGHLHLYWHSPSLRPGLSPFVASTGDVERFYTAIEQYLEGLMASVPVRPVTVSEAAALLGARGGVGQ